MIFAGHEWKKKVLMFADPNCFLLRHYKKAINLGNNWPICRQRCKETVE